MLNQILQHENKIPICRAFQFLKEHNPNCFEKFNQNIICYEMNDV